MTEPHAVARHTDPWTSHQAAASVDQIRESQKALLTLFRICGHMCDEEIAAHYEEYREAFEFPRQSPSGLRTRRSELVDLGLVVNSGQVRRTSSGRRTIVWSKL
jgi:hypothetical protein